MPQVQPLFAPKQLTTKEIAAFVEKGFLILHGIFSAKLAQQIVPLVWNQMDETPDQPATWAQPVRIVEKVLAALPIDEILTQRYRSSVDDLVGAGRWETNLGVGYWVNLFPEPASSKLRPQTKDWHIDTKSDGQNIDSPDLGLTAMEFFTDVEPGGGGTALRVGSHRYVAKLAADGRFRVGGDELSARAPTNRSPARSAHHSAGRRHPADASVHVARFEFEHLSARPNCRQPAVLAL